MFVEYMDGKVLPSQNANASGLSGHNASGLVEAAISPRGPIGRRVASATSGRRATRGTRQAVAVPSPDYAQRVPRSHSDPNGPLVTAVASGAC
jgi:hypothetical protein